MHVRLKPEFQERSRFECVEISALERFEIDLSIGGDRYRGNEILIRRLKSASLIPEDGELSDDSPRLVKLGDLLDEAPEVWRSMGRSRRHIASESLEDEDQLKAYQHLTNLDCTGGFFVPAFRPVEIWSITS